MKRKPAKLAEKSKENDRNGQSGDDEVVWGVDSASLTTSDLLSCVRENFGSPKVWGRYLGEKEGVSAGITPEEAELLKENDIKLLVIWNRFNDATGLENGQSEARANSFNWQRSWESLRVSQFLRISSLIIL